MNESEFEAQLKADGYTEIETQNLDPRPGKGISSRSVDSFFPVLLSSRGIAHRSHLARGKSLPSHTGNCTTNLSEKTVHACW
jgi:hypothetical protein